MTADTDNKSSLKLGLNRINQGQDDEMGIEGYKRSIPKTVVTWVCIVLTIGFLRLVFYWLPHRMIQAMYRKCGLEEADVVVLTNTRMGRMNGVISLAKIKQDQYEQFFVSHVRRCDKHGNELKDKNNARTGYAASMPNKNNSNTDAVYTGDVDLIRYFITKKVKYVWNEEYKEFQKVNGLGERLSCGYFHQATCLSRQEQLLRQVYYGTNSIQIHLTPIVKLLFKEVLSPFYIFQVFSCTLWYYDEYEYYASCIVFISVLSIVVTIYQTRKMQRALRNTIESSTIVTVCRGDDDYQDISSEDLVPGDVIEIPRGGCIMQCDAVLVSGNCIVNESMLTGESVPVTKTPLPNPKLTHEDSVVYVNTKDHSRHMLFSGTHVLQTRYYGGQKVRAVVYRTGFSTSKGELVRSILYPKPVDFKFNKDTYKFVGILAGIAVLGFIYTIVLMVERGEAVGDIIVRSLDLITIAVPPALPAALTVGIVFAQRRMKHAKIYCISPRSINVCGSINTVCFDKTGTLTEEGLDMQSIVPVLSGKFDNAIRNMNLIPKGHFMSGMATCHSLTIIDGVLSGDPLELIMFESIRWELIEPGPEETRFDSLCPTIVYPKTSQRPTADSFALDKQISSDEIGIVRQFTFSSSLQRMSVIVRKLGGDNFDIYTKGAPEMIASLCVQDTVPDDFHDMLMEYTKHGYRVLALAHRELPEKLKYPKIQRIQREQVERGLTFLGLIVMENRLKPVTSPIMQQLQDANIRTIMVTGDNMLTALSVARECSMVMPDEPIILVQAFPAQTDVDGTITEAAHIEYIYTEAPDEGRSNLGYGSGKITRAEDKILPKFDSEMGIRGHYHFAVTGKSWSVINKHFPEIIDKVVVRGTVFARMLPDQKAQLVESLQDMNYYVSMCGDGANDCGALKTAHAGISLSEAEASVASPFTSKTADISCVPNVIREGRAALVTSIGVFKYMACYSLTQFVSVLILYWVGVNLTDFEFLYIDLFLITTLGISFGYTAAYRKLSKDPPLISLLTLAPILSLVLQITIITAFQVFFYFIIQRASWFTHWVDDPEEDYDYQSFENTSVFYISMYQYIILAIVFSKGKPYRKSMMSNFPFIINLIVVICMSIWLNIYPTDPVAEFFELELIPSVPYRFIFIGAAVANLIVCLIVEMFVIESRLVSVKLQDKIDRCLPGARPKHEEVEAYLQNNCNWPPIQHGDLVQTFQRLDSAFQSVSQVNINADTDSLLSSETDSMQGNEYHKTAGYNQESESYSNPGFALEIEDPTPSKGPFSTRL